MTLFLGDEAKVDVALKLKEYEEIYIGEVDENGKRHGKGCK
jgi:hypothetical protein